MSEHLPECNQRDTAWQKSYYSGVECVCGALRACERRSYALGIEVGKHDGWVAGHTAGVQAARDAVAALRPPNAYIGGWYGITVDEAITAIDALTKEDT